MATSFLCTKPRKCLKSSNIKHLPGTPPRMAMVQRTSSPPVFTEDQANNCFIINLLQDARYRDRIPDCPGQVLRLPGHTGKMIAHKMKVPPPRASAIRISDVLSLA